MPPITYCYQHHHGRQHYIAGGLCHVASQQCSDRLADTPPTNQIAHRLIEKVHPSKAVTHCIQHREIYPQSKAGANLEIFKDD
ncbi:hypothetical protein LSAT2_018217 [Lamellibrachia satsuma]|nr:hypothetical protein LSAT2_018217 [Lamellibrachia satsuma]